MLAYIDWMWYFLNACEGCKDSSPHWNDGLWWERGEGRGREGGWREEEGRLMTVSQYTYLEGTSNVWTS